MRDGDLGRYDAARMCRREAQDDALIDRLANH